MLLTYDCTENLRAENRKIVCRKNNGIEAKIEKAMEDQNRHNQFYYEILPSIYGDENE